MRYLTAGDSHGPGLVTIVDGVPAGIPLSAADIEEQLKRRRRGVGRSPRMQAEDEKVSIWGGLYQGRTTGAPLGILIPNRAAPRVEEGAYQVPRPGHADLAGFCKYALPDLMPVQERASARETAARCAAGTVARRLLEEVGVQVFSLVTAIGEVVAAEGDALPDCDPAELAEKWTQWYAEAERSPVRCPWPEVGAAMEKAVREAAGAGETLGGVFWVVALGVPVGLGSCMQGDRRLDGRLAGAVASIPGIKGVEIGLGFGAARRRGSAAHDHILAGFHRPSDRAGGLEGGMTNGQPLLIRAAMKPIPTLLQGLPSLHLQTGEVTRAPAQRADICAVPAAGVVGEAVVAWELACALVERFGGDRVTDIKAGLGR